MKASVRSATRASEPPTLCERSSPQDGDVVVSREVQSRVHYTVHQLPGMIQFSSAVREESMRLARTFAQKYAVDVWYRDVGTYRLLEAYRPRASTRVPHDRE